MSKKVTVRIPNQQVWNEFIEICQEIYGKKHTVMGMELQNALLMWIAHKKQLLEGTPADTSQMTHTQGVTNDGNLANDHSSNKPASDFIFSSKAYQDVVNRVVPTLKSMGAKPVLGKKLLFKMISQSCGVINNRSVETRFLALQKLGLLREKEGGLFEVVFDEKGRP